jgi:Uncharacterized conserved protein (DUF2285)
MPASTKVRAQYIYIPQGESYELALYRWEFLRRNPKYGQDYDHFQSRFGKWLKGKNYWCPLGTESKEWSKSDRSYFQKSVEPILRAYCQEWDVHDLFSPDWSQDSFDPYVEPPLRRVFPPTWFTGSTSYDFRYKRKLHSADSHASARAAVRKNNILQLHINLNLPIRENCDYFERVLRHALRAYATERDDSISPRPKKRRRFQDYGNQLKVWDLHEQGKAIREIAKLVFPNDRQDSVLQKVRDNLHAAERLIQGGYKDIS